MPPAENRRPRPAPRRTRKPAVAKPVGAFARGPLSRADAPITEARTRAHARTRQVQVRARKNVVVPYVPKLAHPTPTQRKAAANIVGRGLRAQGLARPTLKAQQQVNATLPAAQRERANRGTGYAHTISREAQVARGLAAIAHERATAPSRGEAAAGTLGRLAAGLTGGTLAERVAAARELAGVAGLVKTKPTPAPRPLTRADVARIGRTAQRGDPITQLMPAQGRSTKIGGFLTEKTAIAPNLRVLGMPYQVLKALKEEPQARKETVYGVKDLPAGIVTSLAALATPRKAAKMLGEDLSHRYSPLIEGDTAKFRAQLAEPHSGGAVPFALDATTVTPAVGVLATKLARVGALDYAGRVATAGRHFQSSPLKRIVESERPAVAFSSGPEGFVEQVPSNRLGKRLAQHARDKSRARTYRDRIRVMRDNPDTYGPAVRTGPAKRTLDHRVTEARRALAQERPGTEAHDLRAATLAKAEAQARAGVVTHRNALMLPGGRSIEIPKAMRDRRQPRDVARLKGQARLKQLQEQAVLHTQFLDLVRTAPRAERPRLNRIIGYVYGGLVSGASKEKAVADLRELRTQMLEGRAAAVAAKMGPEEAELFKALPLDEQAAHFRIPRGIRRKWNDQVLQLDDLIAEVEKHGVPGSTEHVAKGLRKLETSVAGRNPRLEPVQAQLRRYAPAVESLVHKHDRERETIIQRLRSSDEVQGILKSKELTDEQRSAAVGALYAKATEHLLPSLREAGLDDARLAARADDPRHMGRYIERVGLKRIIGALQSEQRLRPGYFPSERRFKTSFAVKAIGGSKGKPGFRAYHGDLFRTGREDRRPLVLEQALQSGIKDRHQMNLIARQAERHMIDVDSFDPSKAVARDAAGRQRGRREHARQEAKRLLEEARRQGGRGMSVEEELGRVHGLQAEEMLQRRDLLAEHLDEAKAELANVRELAEDDPEAIKAARNDVRRIQRQMARLEERAQELMDGDYYVAPRTPRSDVEPPPARATTTRERGLTPEEESARAEVVTRAERARVQVDVEGKAVKAQRAKVKRLEAKAAKPAVASKRKRSAAPAATEAPKAPARTAAAAEGAQGVPASKWKVTAAQAIPKGDAVHTENGWHGTRYFMVKGGKHTKTRQAESTLIQDAAIDKITPPKKDWAPAELGDEVLLTSRGDPVRTVSGEAGAEILVNADYAAYVEKLTPKGEWRTTGGLKPVVRVNEKGELVGLVMPIRRNIATKSEGAAGDLEATLGRHDAKIADMEQKLADAREKGQKELAEGKQSWSLSTTVPNLERQIAEQRVQRRIAELNAANDGLHTLGSVLEQARLWRELPGTKRPVQQVAIEAAAKRLLKQAGRDVAELDAPAPKPRAERPLPSERASVKRELGDGEPERIDLDPEKQPLIELNYGGELVRGRLERIRRRRLANPDRWGEWRVQVRREGSPEGETGSRAEFLASDLQGFKLVEGELPQELQGLVSGERAGLARGPEIIEGTAHDPKLAAQLEAERAKLIAAEARHQVVKDELAAHEQELAHYDGRAKETVTVDDPAAPLAEPAAAPEPGPREPGASQQRAARERLRKATESGVGQPIKELIDDLDEAQINPDHDVTFLNVGRLFRDVSEERLGAVDAAITSPLDANLSHALRNPRIVLEGEQIRALREKTDPNAFTEYGNGWVAVPRKVGEEILSMAQGRGVLAGRLFDITKGKASRVLLGLGNVSWLGFQVASNAFLSGLVGVGPFTQIRAQMWWKGLTDEQRSYMSSIMGTTAHHVDFEQRSLGAAAADSQLVEGWRALKDTPAWRAAHKANPIDAMFRMDHAQTAFFRRAVLYKYAKREAFQRMGEGIGHAMRAQDRLEHTFFADAGKTDRHITNVLRDRRGIEEHARRVDEILGEYMTFTATERASLNRFLMFYGFLRHSMRLLFWTLPTGHPIALSVLTQLGRLQADEARQLLGGDQLPYGLGKVYWRAGDKTRAVFHKFGIEVPDGQLMQVDLARMNPALNGVTELKSRNQVFQVFPPYIALAVEGATSQNLLTGYTWRVNGETSHKAGTPYSPGSWARVMLSRTLQLVPPYRYASKWWFHGRQQGDDALLFSAKPVVYKRADKLAQQKERQDRDASKTTVARVGEILFPMFPQVSHDDQVVTNKQLQRKGGSQRAPLPASVPKHVADRVNAALDRADKAAKDAVPADVQKRIDEALARAAAAGR